MATQEQAVKDRFAYIDADAEVVRLQAELEQARKVADSTRCEARQALREIPRLLLAADCVQRQLWKLEGVEGEASDQLEQYTTDDAECWWWQWEKAYEAVEALALQQCQKTAALFAKTEQLEQDRSAVCDEWLAARAAAGARFTAEHAS